MGAFYTTGRAISYIPLRYHWSITPSPGTANVVSYTNDTFMLAGDRVQAYRTFFLGASETTPRSVSLSVDETAVQVMGFGMYYTGSLGGWIAGDALSDLFAWENGITTALTSFGLMYSAAAVSGTPLSPSMLLGFTATDAQLFVRTNLRNQHADLWGFVGSGFTARPRWQVYSSSVGQEDILLDAWINPSTNGTEWTDHWVQGFDVHKSNATTYFRRLFGGNASGGFGNYQDLLTLGSGGVNFYPPDNHHGGRAILVLTVSGETASADAYGAYYDEAQTLRSGINLQPTYLVTYEVGDWAVQRCTAVALDAPVLGCADVLSIGLAGIDIDDPTHFSSTLLVDGAATFSSSVALNGSPQLSTVLLTPSGGTGSTETLKGDKIIVSEYNVNGGKMIESNSTFDLNLEYHAEDIGNITVYITVEGSGCGGPTTVPTSCSAATCLYARSQTQITYTCSSGCVLSVPDTCGGSSTASNVFLQITGPRVTQFPFPASNNVYLTMGRISNIPNAYAAWMDSGQINMLPMFGAVFAAPPYNTVDTYRLPDTMSFTYLVAP